MNRAYLTPGQGLISPFATSACKSCAAYEQEVSELAAKRQRFDREPVEVLEVSMAPERQPAGMSLVDVTIRQTPAQIIDDTGKVTLRVVENKAVLAIELAWRDTGWLVQTVKVRTT